MKNLFYKLYIKLSTILTYGAETWATTEKQRAKMDATGMRFLRKIENKTIMDKIKNETYRQNLQVKAIKDKIEEGQLRWFGHLKRMSENRLTRKVYEARITKKRTRGRPRRIWQDEVRKAAEKRGVQWENIGRDIEDRKRWKEIWSRSTS